MKRDQSNPKKADRGREFGRRTFLRSIGGIGAVAFGAKVLGWSSPAAAQSAQASEVQRSDAEARAIRAHGAIPKTRSLLDKLTIDTFARHLNTKFRVQAESGDVAELELIEVADRNTRKAKGLETFSIVFRGRGDSALEQGGYKFEHGQIGNFDLFIVPIGEDAEGRYYEAIFNRFSR